jgi:heme/copper-type cytochrome/quinol oxidase subunit 3
MSEAFEATRPPALPTYPKGVEGGASTAFWGMVLLIFTEATFFVLLFISYAYLRFQSGVTWPPDGIAKPDLAKVAVMTPILVLSSIPAHWAAIGIRKGKVRQLRIGLIVAILQGATFLGLQATEYTALAKQFTPKTDSYGSLFCTITGFHGLHVAVGLVLLTWLLVYAFAGRWTANNHVPVQNVILYWHFVDAVWVFILMILYISPHWWP